MSIVHEVNLAQLNSLVVIVNTSGKVEYVSPSVKRILGFNPDELLGEGWWKRTRATPQEQREIKTLVADWLSRKSIRDTQPEERKLRNVWNEERWFSWSISRGFLNKIIAIGFDITERREQELSLRQRIRELEQQNSDIWASIRYARQIQESILPKTNTLDDALSGHFVIYLPKDLVSGDFYFFHRRGPLQFVVVVDCTGHGVPGALMTTIANSLLKQVIVKSATSDPAQILYRLDEELRLWMDHHQNIQARDGMDVAVAVIDTSENKLHYAGAFRPAMLIRNKTDWHELPASRYPIGFYGDTTKEFNAHCRPLEKGDRLYLFTDGYCDQFGGENGKKFNRSRFRELLLSSVNMPMEEQSAYIRYAFNNWKQNEPQVDDILVVGLEY